MLYLLTSSVCGPGSDLCGIRIISLANRFRTAACSGTLANGLAKVRVGRDYDGASISFLTPTDPLEYSCERVRRWQRPREKAVLQGTKEEGARVQEKVLSSFASTAETNEQKKVRIVVPPEVPHDTRNCIGDLVDTETDQLRNYEKKVKQPGAGTQEPVKKTARDWNPRTREQRAVPTAGRRIRI